MTREKQIEEAARKHYQERPVGFGEPVYDFEFGAEWADQTNPYKAMLDIAVEALKFISQDEPCSDYVAKEALDKIEKMRGELK